jgi:predicted secreted protein
MGGHGPILLGAEPVAADVAAGDEVSVEAVENAGTGYVWHLAADPPDGVEVLDESYSPSGGAPGGPGRRTWLLRVRQGPRVRLTATLRRPWEDAAQQIATAELNVIG